jgi:hypothetical protein
MLRHLDVKVSSCLMTQHVRHMYNMGAAPAPPLPAFGRAAVCLRELYLDFVTTGAGVRLVFETCGSNKRVDFSCTNPSPLHAQGSKRPANTRR